MIERHIGGMGVVLVTSSMKYSVEIGYWNFPAAFCGSSPARDFSSEATVSYSISLNGMVTGSSF